VPRVVVALLLFAALLPASYLARLDIQPAQRNAFVAEELPVYKDLGTSLILPLSGGQLATLQSRGWQAEVLDTDLSPGNYFVIYKAGLGAGSVPGRVLWQSERLQLVRLPELDARAAKAAGFPIVRLPLVPHPLPSPLAPLSVFPYGADTTVARIVSLVSQDSLTRTIRDLQDFGTRYSYRPKCESAAFYLRTRLTDLGYTVRLDTYYLTSPTTRSFNVEATLDGTAAPESIVIACSHYDSYSTNFDSAPGANDDGSGTAAVIELARVLKQAQFRLSVKFLCFSGEEQWMKGSYHWVDSTATIESLIIPGVYNLDMFGYTAYDTNMLYVTRNTASLSLGMLAESANVWYDIGLQVVNFLDEDCAGDNAPFWEHGYKAVFACEDSEWGIWRGSDPYYHTPGDTIGNVRMGQVLRTTQLASACLATQTLGLEWVDLAEGTRPQAASFKPQATIVREALLMPGDRGPGTEDRAALLDVAGREVMRVKPGPNDVHGLVPGVYFVRGSDPGVSRRVVKLR
jgi:aminopeptidase YwaD